MKKGHRQRANDIHPEYDFSTMKGGVRGKYVRRFRAGTNLVLLDPELVEAFPTDSAVNHALRAVLTIRNLAKPHNKVGPSTGRGRSRKWFMELDRLSAGPFMARGLQGRRQPRTPKREIFK